MKCVSARVAKAAAAVILIVLFGVLLFMDWLAPLAAWMTRLGIGWVPDL